MQLTETMNIIRKVGVSVPVRGVSCNINAVEKMHFLSVSVPVRGVSCNMNHLI